MCKDPASAGMKLLIVDDSRAVRSRLGALLAPIRSLATEQAASLGEAAAILERFRPDALVLDIQLPDGNGLSLLEPVKRSHPATRVMMFSNHLAYRQRCLSLGADAFFDKSMDFEDLIDRIRRDAERSAA